MPRTKTGRFAGGRAAKVAGRKGGRKSSKKK